jgi:hypothetical protein
MNEKNFLQQLLQKAGIKSEETFSGDGPDCPVCGVGHSRAA